MIERPRCCPEPTCTPIFQWPWNIGPKFPTGESFSCFGIMEAPIHFQYDGIDHDNDLNHCDYTPLKGMIRWQENEEDWEGLAEMAKRAIAALHKHQEAKP